MLWTTDVDRSTGSMRGTVWPRRSVLPEREGRCSAAEGSRRLPELIAHGRRAHARARQPMDDAAIGAVKRFEGLDAGESGEDDDLRSLYACSASLLSARPE